MGIHISEVEHRLVLKNDDKLLEALRKHLLSDEKHLTWFSTTTEKVESMSLVDLLYLIGYVAEPGNLVPDLVKDDSIGFDDPSVLSILERSNYDWKYEPNLDEDLMDVMAPFVYSGSTLSFAEGRRWWGFIFIDGKRRMDMDV